LREYSLIDDVVGMRLDINNTLILGLKTYFDESLNTIYVSSLHSYHYICNIYGDHTSHIVDERDTALSLSDEHGVALSSPTSAARLSLRLRPILIPQFLTNSWGEYHTLILRQGSMSMTLTRRVYLVLGVVIHE
jgi:hypothetical protein